MRLLSPLLKRVAYPALSSSGCLRLLPHNRPAVVTYHGVLPERYRPRHWALDGHLVSESLFREQIELLRSKYNLISAAEFLAWSEGKLELPRRSVLLTCDDGLLNVLTDMLPVIQEMRLPFLFFVTGASTSQARSMPWHEKLFLWLLERRSVPMWIPPKPQLAAAGSSRQIVGLWQHLIKELSSLEAEARNTALNEIRIQVGISEQWESTYSEDDALRRRFFMMNSQDLKAVAEAGITVGSHTLSHPMLSRMTEDAAYMEIKESMLRIEAAVERPVRFLAYPFGGPEAVAARELQLARRAGFLCTFKNTEDGSGVNRHFYPRVHVSFETSPAELDAHVSGLHQLLRDRFRHPGASLAG